MHWCLQHGAQTQEAVKTREKYTLQSAAGKSRYEVGEGQRIAVSNSLHLKRITAPAGPSLPCIEVLGSC